MFHQSEIVRKEIVKLIPASLINDIACFVFYDNYPRDPKLIDITICTKNGKIIEFYQRTALLTMTLNSKITPEEIVIIRNSVGKLFYIVSAGELLFILERKESIKLHKTVSDVLGFEIVDQNCSGLPFMKVILKSDAVPLVYDDNFENIGETFNLDQSMKEAASPVVVQLQRKLREAKYNVKCNENTLNNMMSLRQRVAFAQYQKLYPNLKDNSLINIAEIATALKIKSQKPWVKSCNQKLVIVFNVINENKVPFDNVNVLLSNTSKSLVYTTKIFEKYIQPPFWNESITQKINYNIETAIVTVIDVNQLKNNVLSGIEFKGVICYKKEGKDYLLPFSDVKISSLDTMGENFDVLSLNKYDENNMLAILATTEKRDLLLKYAMNMEKTEVLDFQEIFCKYLQMEIICSNVIIHRKSPYHILNSLMIILHNNDLDGTLISVYARSTSQILALLHYMSDIIPYKIIAKIYSHEMDTDESISTNETNLESNGSNKINLILQYLNNYMSEARNHPVQRRVYMDQNEMSLDDESD